MKRLRWGSLAALVAVVVSLSGSVVAGAASGVNWSQEGFNAQHTNFNRLETTLTRSNVGHLVRAFDTPISTGPDPIVANGEVYLSASIDGTVQAVNAVTGSVDWTANACNTGEQTTAPAFAAAKVWVGLDDPGTAGITSSGSTVACLPSDLYTSPPSTYNGVVFAGGADGVVVAIKAGSSTILWQTCVGCARSGGPTLATPAVSTDGKWLFIGSPATGDVYKLNAQTGALVWTRFVDSCATSCGGAAFTPGRKPLEPSPPAREAAPPGLPTPANGRRSACRRSPGKGRRVGRPFSNSGGGVAQL